MAPFWSHFSVEDMALFWSHFSVEIDVARLCRRYQVFLIASQIPFLILAWRWSHFVIEVFRIPQGVYRKCVTGLPRS